MKKIFVLALLLAMSLPVVSFAYTRVGGYMKKSGTYVMPHYRTNSDSLRINNWTTKGNSNPFTGKKGYKSYSGW
jgi:hypothetical protein